MSNPVIILHNRLSDAPATDELDVLEQVELVRSALTDLGFSCLIMDVGTDLYGDLQKIRGLSPAFVFNLVETVFGKSELLSVVPSLLSSFQIPYTGATAESLFLTTNKLLAKKMMRQNGIATPDWFLPEQAGSHLRSGKKYILKPVAEEGSVGLEENAVFSGNLPRLDLKTGEYFVEAFIEGREFNVSVVGRPGRFRVFPVAEMIFHDFPAGKERVLGYRAKWDEQSFEYRHTQRAFHTLDSDPGLASALEASALQCGEVFGMSGYFRVDFRVSEEKEPYVLEINGNPCISPDSGFIAAVHQSGISVTEVIRQIVISSFPPGFTSLKEI